MIFYGYVNNRTDSIKASFFDSLQSYQDTKQKNNVTGKWEIVKSTEGISSQYAQKFGHD